MDAGALPATRMQRYGPNELERQGNLPRARRIGSEMWESLALTLAGVAGNSIGKVLQKKGTLILPPLSFKLKVIRGCALNMLSQAPVRLPPGHVRRRPHAHHALTGAGLCCADGCGLATLCIFSNFYLKEVMNGLDWIAITMTGLGTIGVCVREEEQKVEEIPFFSIPWLVLTVVIFFAGFAQHLASYLQKAKARTMLGCSLATFQTEGESGEAEEETRER